MRVSVKGLKSIFKGNMRQYSMLIALVLIVILFQLTTGGKLLFPKNVSNIVFQNAYVIILAVGMLMCILTGGNIDLSIGSILAVVMACAGTGIMTWKADPYLTMVVCLGIGILIGAWQGFWIAYVGIPAFIVTLSGMLIFRGLTLFILQGMTLSNFPVSFLQLSTGFVPDFLGGISLFGMTYNGVCLMTGVLLAVVFAVMQVLRNINRRKKGYEPEQPLALILKVIIVGAGLIWFFGLLAQANGVPTVLITVGVILVLYSFITGSTVLGRHLYALGGNQKAAWLSGVNTKRLMFLAYTNMGLLAGVAGLVCASRFNSAFPLAGQGYELDAIAACFIGGASASGGIGTVSGALIGALIMGTLNNGMTIMGVNQYMQQVVKGLVLLVAVAFDVISKTRYGFETAGKIWAWVKDLFRFQKKEVAVRFVGRLLAIVGLFSLVASVLGFILYLLVAMSGGAMLITSSGFIAILLAPFFFIAQGRLILFIIGAVFIGAGFLLRSGKPVQQESNASTSVKS